MMHYRGGTVKGIHHMDLADPAPPVASRAHTGRIGRIGRMSLETPSFPDLVTSGVAVPAVAGAFESYI